MQSRSFRKLAAPGGLKRGPRFPWARVLLLLGIVAAAVYLFMPRFLNLTASGLVEGDLVPVAPIFRAQINRPLVQCNDVVRRGQPLAVVSNFLLEQQYAQDIQKLQDELQLARISDVEGLAQARIDLETSREKFQASDLETQKQSVLYGGYDRAYKAGAVGRVSWEAAHAEWQSAAAQAQGYRSIMNAADERIRRLEAAGATKVETLNAEISQLESFKEKVRAQTLRAPVSGHIVDCAARPMAIVEAGTPLYHIFGTDRAYVMAFYNPSAAASMHVGTNATVEIAGMPDKITGTVTALYPTLAKLPDALTKYFWQHVQWSEYRPVKIAFKNLPADLRDQLVYGAQATVKIPQHRAIMTASTLRLAFP